MKSAKFAITAAVAMVLMPLPGRAADAAHGLALAQRWCAACHLVSSGQKQASADVPPFATIAQSPRFNARTLAYFLLDPHPKMPDLPLTRAQAEDIAAYIASLKK